MSEQTVPPKKIVVIDCSDQQDTMIPVIDEFRSHSNIQIEFIWKSAEQLSRSQGRQLGRTYTETPIMVSTESDILFPLNLIEETLKGFGNPPKKLYVQPWIAAYDANNKLGQIFKQHRSGFFQAFRVCDFDNVGGYNPFLINWGFEDADIKERLIKFGCAETTIPLMVTHQWHPKVASNIENIRNYEVTRHSYFDNRDRTWKLEDGFCI